MTVNETENAHVLVAEDDQAFRELLCFTLFRAGYTVTSCADGLTLLERLEGHLQGKEDRFDLVISDVRMPALTGLEVLEALHDQPRRPPLICMTAFGDPATHAMARDLGATATLDKPFAIECLLEEVAAICRRKVH